MLILPATSTSKTIDTFFHSQDKSQRSVHPQTDISMRGSTEFPTGIFTMDQVFVGFASHSSGIWAKVR